MREYTVSEHWKVKLPLNASALLQLLAVTRGLRLSLDTVALAVGVLTLSVSLSPDSSELDSFSTTYTQYTLTSYIYHTHKLATCGTMYLSDDAIQIMSIPGPAPLEASCQL